MPETYTSGVWIVKPGEEEAFVRDMEQPSRYMSFAPWESFDAQNAWKQEPGFRERIMRVRSHCEDFQPWVFELVTTVE